MRLILTGSIAIDRILNFPGKFVDLIQPDKLHVISVSVLIERLKDTRGGIAANIGYTLALLGEKPVLLGAVGKEAKPYMKDLHTLGINIKHVHYSSLPTASFTVMTDISDCQVGGFYPGAMSDSKTLIFSEFDPKKDFLVISPHDPVAMRRQVKEAKKRKFRYFYDVGQQVINISSEDITNGVNGAELLIVNDYEMGVIEKKTGMAQKEILKKVKVVVVTLGEKGSQFYVEGKPGKVVAVPIKKVIDPTGAGDAFRGGFLYGYNKGWDIETCCQLGSITATFAISKQGTQEHHFTKEQIAKIAKKHYGVVLSF